MTSCKRASELISASLDRRLGLAERISLFVHMVVCRMCRAYHKQLVFIRSAARDLGEDARGGGERLDEDARERMKQRLKEAAR